MEINVASLKAFRVDFTKAVADLEKKYGVKIELGSIGYDTTKFHGRMTVAFVDATTGEKKVDASMFEAYKALYGLKCDLGFTFTAPGGKSMKVVNFDPKKKKNNVILQGADGKTYVAPVSYVNLFSPATTIN